MHNKLLVTTESVLNHYSFSKYIANSTDEITNKFYCSMDYGNTSPLYLRLYNTGHLSCSSVTHSQFTTQPQFTL